MKTTFIYVLLDPRSGLIRYVGKSDNPKWRFTKHLKDLRSTYRTRWVQSLLARGLKPILEVIDEVPLAEWQFWEREYIRVFRLVGMRLANTTEGGDGMFNPTPEVREKLRRSRAMQKMPPISPERRAAVSARFRGKPLSKEHREKLRDNSLKRTNLTERMDKIRALRKYVPYSAERKRSISERLMGHNTSEATRSKIRLAALGRKRPPEVVAKFQAALMGRKLSASHRANITAGLLKHYQAHAKPSVFVAQFFAFHDQVCNK